ncbi:MAG: radical SAM protein [Candidatus Diapherotrites archaeon]
MAKIEKIKALAEAGKYDLSCSCNEERKRKDLPKIDSNELSMIYRASMPENKFIYLFKTLYSNACSFDCKYCVNSSECINKKNKMSYSPEELAKTFKLLHNKKLVDGIFLSSAICGEPDKVMESMIEATELIRFKQNFQGYIHLKVLPGTNFDLVKRATELAQRVSINIESTGKQRLNELSSQKEFQTDLIKRQKWIQKLNDSNQTTQLVVGAAGETDKEIIKTMDYEYKEIKIERMYYSAFKPIQNTPLENKKGIDSIRQFRLYNSDYLYRSYGVKKNELIEIMDENDFLPRTDPKIALAQNFFDSALDPNQAKYSELLRVPGIGHKTAQKVKEFAEKEKINSRKQLKSLGVILRRADPFLKLNGWKQGNLREWN